MDAPRPFWNDGGPLLVAPEAAVPLWEGADPPSGGRVVRASFRYGAPDAPATDYDRACDASAESAVLLPVGDSWVIVLGTAQFQSALWLPGAARELYAVGIEAADDDAPDRLRALAAAQPPGAWRTVSPGLAVGPGGLLLAHAASRLSEVEELSALVPAGEPDARAALIGDGLRLAAPEGRYAAAVCDVETPDGEYLTFVRFTLAAPAA